MDRTQFTHGKKEFKTGFIETKYNTMEIWTGAWTEGWSLAWARLRAGAWLGF